MQIFCNLPHPYWSLHVEESGFWMQELRLPRVLDTPLKHENSQKSNIAIIFCINVTNKKDLNICIYVLLRVSFFMRYPFAAFTSSFIVIGSETSLRPGLSVSRSVIIFQKSKKFHFHMLPYKHLNIMHIIHILSKLNFMCLLVICFKVFRN